MKFLSNTVLSELLESSTEQELISLSNLIEEKKLDKSLKIETIVDEISSIGGHSIANIFRGFNGTGYLDILDDIANELSIKNIPSYEYEVKYFDEIDNLKHTKEKSIELGIKYAEEIEELIIFKILEMSYEKMTKEERKSFDAQINEIANKFNSNSTTYLSGGAGLIALGNLGGFATYTFLTTSLSTLSLGFATYTGATTLLSLILGPIGWTGLGTIALLTLGSPNTKKLIPIVATIGAIRQRIKYENKNLQVQRNNITNHDDKNYKKSIEYNTYNLLSKKEYSFYWLNQIINLTLPSEEDIMNLCFDDDYNQKNIWFRNKSGEISIFYKGIYESYERLDNKVNKAYLLQFEVD